VLVGTRASESYLLCLFFLADADIEYEGLNVALLGIGSSAIQILPHLQRKCKDVHLFARGGTWISEPFGGSASQETISGDKDSGNCM
jgi:cation diffusion facilitator CzcD-associated flavoprotein CzcO